MFSKKMMMIVGVIVLVAVNIIILSFTSSRYSSYGPGRFAVYFITPLQKAVSSSIYFLKDIWGHYFFLASAAQENEELKKALKYAIKQNNRYKEVQNSNYRLRKLLNFRKKMDSQLLVAEVIGKDPSPWFKTIIIDKGKSAGVEKGLPVVVPEGIVGQVIDLSYRYSKILLIIDNNSAVDALVQRTRARGIVKGVSTDKCLLKYALRKHDIKVGDTVISSGLDGVFPKGMLIGNVTEIIKHSSGMFQEVSVSPYVDFEKLEEVLVVLNPQKHDYVGKE